MTEKTQCYFMLKSWSIHLAYSTVFVHSISFYSFPCVIWMLPRYPMFLINISPQIWQKDGRAIQNGFSCHVGFLKVIQDLINHSLLRTEGSNENRNNMQDKPLAISDYFLSTKLVRFQRAFNLKML